MANPLRADDIDNFDILRAACKAGDLGLLSTTRKSDGADVALVCVINEGPNEIFRIFPVAIMIEGDPFELFNPPNSEASHDKKPESSEAGREIPVQRKDESGDGQSNL